MKSLQHGLGYLLGLVALAIALGTDQAPVGWLHWPALLAVVGGTAAFALTSCPVAAFRRLNETPPDGDVAGAVVRLTELAGIYRLAGIRGLERQLDEAAGPMERHGLRLVCVGCEPAGLEAALRRLARGLDEADREPLELWSALAQGAVTSGILVTLTGMVQALWLAPAELSAARLAGSLLATAYGLFIGQLIAGPRVAQRRRRLRRAAIERELWIEGMLLLHGGTHPRLVADRLRASADEPAARAA